MAGLQRSVTSFRRQGSSGLVWDDRLISSESNQIDPAKQDPPKPDSKDRHRPPPRTAGALDRSPSSGGGGGGGGPRPLHLGKVSPSIAPDPPSPKLSRCGCCAPIGANPKEPKSSGKRKSR